MAKARSVKSFVTKTWYKSRRGDKAITEAKYVPSVWKDAELTARREGKEGWMRRDEGKKKQRMAGKALKGCGSHINLCLNL